MQSAKQAGEKAGKTVGPLLLGIDVGTTSVSTALIDTVSARVWTASVPHHSDVEPTRSSSHEQSVGKVLDCVRTAVAIVIESTVAAESSGDNSGRNSGGTKSGSVAGNSGETSADNRLRRVEDLGRIGAIGVTSQMHGIVGLGPTGEPATNLVTWQDSSGLIPWGRGTLLDEILRRGGPDVRIASGYGAVTLFRWVHAERRRDIASVCTIGDLLVMRLRGSNEPVMDFTMADSLGVFDQTRGSWSDELIGALGLPRSAFPRLVSPAGEAGESSAGALEGLLPAGIPVMVAMGDNQAGFIGSVPPHGRGMLVNVGTGAQLSVRLGREEADDARKLADGFDVSVRPFLDGGSLLVASMLDGGAALDALHEFFLKAARELFGIQGESISDELWIRMEHVASRANTAGLSVTPTLSGTRSRPDLRGAISGIGAANLTPGSMVRATLEGMVETLATMLPADFRHRPDALVGGGNALRRNALLRSIVSERFGRPLDLTPVPEEAAVGAAIAAAAAGNSRGERSLTIDPTTLSVG